MQLSMKLPYSSEALSAFITGYHEKIWPVQIIAVFLTVTVLYALYRPFLQSGRLVGLVLILFWIWSGYVYYIREFSALSFLAPTYGIFFLLQAALLVWFVVTPNSLNFQFARYSKGWAGIVFIVLALLIYPLAMVLYEGQWKSYHLVGVTPLSTALFSMGAIMQTNAGARLKFIMNIIPVIYILSSCITAWILL